MGKRIQHDLGENVRRQRDAMDLTQAQLAEMVTETGLRMYQSTIHKIETASRPTPAEEVVVLAEVLRVSPADLLEPPGTETPRIKSLRQRITSNADAIRTLQRGIQKDMATLDKLLGEKS